MADSNPSCETCMNYVYDEEYDDYVCIANIDEDEYYRYIQNNRCPYFRFGDDYTIVKKQI